LPELGDVSTAPACFGRQKLHPWVSWVGTYIHSTKILPFFPMHCRKLSFFPTLLYTQQHFTYVRQQFLPYIYIIIVRTVLRLLIVKDRQKNVRPDRQTIKVSENLTLPSDILYRPCNIKMSDRCQTDVRWIHSVNMLPIQLNQLYLIFISFHCIKYAQIVELLILQMPNSETSHFVLH